MRIVLPYRRHTARSLRADNPEVTGHRSRMLDALHVFVLTSFAVSQPVYDRLGQRVSFLVDGGVSPTAVFLLVALVSVALPGMLVLAERCAALCGTRMYEAWHAVTVFILLLLVALPACKRCDLLLTAELVFGLALAVSILGVWGYFVSRRVRAAITLAAPGILLFPGVLLFGSSVSGILLTPQPIRIDSWTPVPVVMLVFDEFCGASLMKTDRQIDSDRFPNFARLAGQSTWFRNATTVVGETRQALPAILSGCYPGKSTWAPLPTDLPQNLFSILESTGGYELAAFEPVSSLATDYRESGDGRRPDLRKQIVLVLDAVSRVYLFHVVPSGYGKQLPLIPPLWFGIRDSEKVDRNGRRGVFRYAWDDDRGHQFQHFLKCLEPNADPMLYFMHLVIPHVSWCYLPSGHRYTADSDTVDLLNLHSHHDLLVYWGQDELLVAQQQLRYLLQLQYVDRLIGELMARLRETGLYDRCLLVVTADHGVSFRTNQPRRDLSKANQADILSIPLFVKRPSQTAGEISDRHVESVDILPTVTDVLGIKLRDSIDGQSAIDESLPGRTGRTFFQIDHQRQKLERVSVDPEIVAQSDFPHLTQSRFGQLRDADDLFRIGPIPELVGRSVESLARSHANPLEMQMIRSGDICDEAPGAIVPCFFEGLVLSSIENDRPETLAVSVNGTIRSVTRTYLLNGLRNRWAALVPESAFHPGKNDVRFFAVSRSGSDWELSPCAVRRAQ